MVSQRAKKILWVIAVVTIVILSGVGVWLYIYFGTENEICSEVAKKKVLNYDNILNCYRSFKFNSSEANETIENLRQQMQLSSIVDFLKENPEPHFSNKIDVDSDLSRIGNQTYNSDFDFHYTLTKYFKKLQEGHTEYYNRIYNFIMFELPISLIPYHDQEGKVLLKVSEYTPHIELVREWESRGFKLSNYKNDIVLEIDGIPAMEYIQKYADEFVGLSRDPNFRVAATLSRKLQFSPGVVFDPGYFTKNTLPPSQDTISVTFKNNGKVSLPYLVLNRALFPEYQSIEGTQSGSILSNSFMNPPSLVPYNSLVAQSSLKRLPKSKQIPSLFLGDHIKIYHVKDAAVIYIPKFPIDSKSESIWDDELYHACIILKKSNIEKVIFDMSNNPGGIINSAYDLLRYFFPESRHQLFENYLTNKRSLREFGTKLKSTYEKSKADPKLDNIKKKELMFFQDIINSIDNSVNSGDPRIPANLRWTNNEKLATLITDTPPIPYHSIAVMSNGFCASACALFSNWIQEMTKVPTYHVGDFLAQPATVGSCIGGSLATINNLEQPNAVTAFSRFKNDTFFQFSLLGFYSKTKPTQALDFTWLPAQHKIPVTEADLNSPVAIWSQIIDEMADQPQE